MTHEHPLTAAGITPNYLTTLLADASQGTRVDEVSIADAKTYGEQFVSTAGRVIIDVRYGANPDGLPSRLVIKLARDDKIMGSMYANEVAFYRRIRPELSIEAPACFGGNYDADSLSFALVLEDLTKRNVRFPNVTQPVTLEEIRGILDALAALHGRFWASPRFEDDLAWVETHIAGGVADMMNGLAPTYIQHEVDHENFKRELVQRLRTTPAKMLAAVQAVQRHQSTLPQTLLHGDTHLGNTYLLPGSGGGLLDWQLMVRGYHIHDVNYLITTALPIGERRAQERDLLCYYLDRLAAEGGRPLSFDDTWLEYRRALMWGVYIGWLTTPVVNYGWEINVLNHLRLTTAFEDHETSQAISDLL